jgi:GNAT superfamily N-acetyltransferase
MADLDVRPVTSDRWNDLLALFGERGAYSGCWCMWFRVRPRDWKRNGNEGNRAAMEAIVADDRVPGLLAYRDGEPVGWMSVAPREAFERIAGDPAAAAAESAVLADLEPVWSVVCFYIDRHHRGQGVATRLLDAAIDHARTGGARTLEAYPIEPEGRTDNASAFTGLRSMFEAAGFREVGRFDRWRAAPLAGSDGAKRLVRPPGRPVLRLDLAQLPRATPSRRRSSPGMPRRARSAAMPSRSSTVT